MTTLRIVAFGANKQNVAPVNATKQPTLGEVRGKMKACENKCDLGQRQVNDLTMTSNGYTALNTLLIVIGVIILVPLAILVSAYALVGLLPLVVIGLTLAILAARKDSETDDAKSKLKSNEIEHYALQQELRSISKARSVLSR